MAQDLLAEGLFNEDEAIAEATAEWEADGNVGTKMTKKKYLDAIFEIVDVYTETIDVDGTLRYRVSSSHGAVHLLFSDSAVRPSV